MNNQTNAQKIKAALKQTKSATQHARIVAVNMVRIKGYTISAAADVLGVDRSTIYDWLNAYDHKGLDGLADGARPGRPSFVPRHTLENIINGVKRFTAYGFVKLAEKKTGIKYSESQARRILRSLGFTIRKTPRISDRIPPRKDLEIWQKDTKKEAEMFEKDGFTLVMVDESHQNLSMFGSGAVYTRGDAIPVQTPLGNQRQTIYGGITLDGQTCYMAASKANDRSFIRYLNKTKKRFGKVAVILDNAAYHNSSRVKRYLKKNSDFIKLIFLPPYSPFLNPAEWLWLNGKARIRRTFKRPAKRYFRRKIMRIYESLEIKFDPRSILFRNLDKILPV